MCGYGLALKRICGAHGLTLREMSGFSLSSLKKDVWQIGIFLIVEIFSSFNGNEDHHYFIIVQNFVFPPKMCTTWINLEALRYTACKAKVIL